MKFKVGDVCITQNSRVPLLNNNKLVVIVGVDPNYVSVRNEITPYRIRRLDGQPHAKTIDPKTGLSNWYKSINAVCPERMLRKPKKGDLPDDLVIGKSKPKIQTKKQAKTTFIKTAVPEVTP